MQMGHVVVEGVSVPAAIASSFSDPKKRPFSYTEPLPPSAERPRTPHVPVPKVLPIVADSDNQNQSKPMVVTEVPANLQYNTPLPLYSREAAEEQLKQQLGSGPDLTLGAGDKHFDPEKSETLKAIQAGEDDSFGRTFFEKIAQAEAPKIPVSLEPAWTETARRKAERARSATPTSYASRHTPTPYYYNPNYATIHDTSTTSTKKKTPVRNRGYEFGGLDYVDKSRIPENPSYEYYYYQPKPAREERRTTPGYEMGGLDFGKGNVGYQGPYHGHGPENPRLQPKYDTTRLKHHEMNIETAPNINNVSADVLVGDTVSNQKILKDKETHNPHPFGTSFGPPSGFKEDHRTVNRRQESYRPTTYSLSARKDYIGQGNLGYTPYQENRYRTKSRSYSAAPADRYDSGAYGTGEKEVTVETLLSGSALYPRKTTVIPEWYTYSLEKQNRWKNGLDPRHTRSQNRGHQPPHWYMKAKQMHNTWQSAAERNASRAQSEFTRDSSRYVTNQDYTDYGTSYTTESRHTQNYRTNVGSQQQYKQEITDNQQRSWSTQRDVPITQNTYGVQNSIPAPFEQSTTTQSYSGQLQKWEPKSEPTTNQTYYSSSQYEKDESKSTYSGSKYQKQETRENYISQPRTTRTYETYQTEGTQQSPTTTKQVVTVTEGTGSDFNRVAEMAESLPRGTIANTQANTQGNYTDADGRAVSYTRELVTSVDPNRECSLLKEEERRVVETPLEPGVISRHITTKYYKKKTVTDTTTTTTTRLPQ